MRILITGGSGFLGRHLAHKLCARGDTVCIYSRDEVKQANMRLEFKDVPNIRFFIGDIRDAGRLERAMRGCDAVIAAAALKRIETGFFNPSEMVATNITGTQNSIDAAATTGVSRFVFVSTDKAYQPISAYGLSKALAENLVINANHVYGNRGPLYRCVRFGNVAGSTGSIIPAWRNILKTTDVVPVTDPDATRFWMSISDACDFVIRSLDLVVNEIEIPILPAYRVGDLAEAMGAKTNVIGLPVWEKKHEGMCDGNTSDNARRMTVEELNITLESV